MKSKRLVYVLIACLCLMLCGCEKNLDNTQQSKTPLFLLHKKQRQTALNMKFATHMLKSRDTAKANLPYLFLKP